ncbi:polysaccharide pyruvyl transferase CsaB [Natroniella sulfidigena]|uniref:polysaccharide pyruvyl transferase CsaB n=1 Tax=Natroniella sulfidigena TaxID=723921 RepID=UPI00200A8904|nr:polysaccharide pyruvyl transferase CsaB [Natroniella sulfidigena]MCK8816002.1 polysaccharide pyruvyl transferase CsaB [Natroniella sulfidigena]
MEKIILSGYYGFNNAGDEAILAALVVGLKKVLGQVEIIVLSANPSWTEEVHGVEAISRTNLVEITRQLKEADLLISGGGSLLQDVTSMKTIPYYLSIMILAKSLKVPVFFCAQGVGPINSTINQKLVKSVLKRVDLITVRDQNSKELLRRIGVRDPIDVTADPVFMLEAVNQDRIEAILAEEGIDLAQQTVGISIRSWGDNSYLKQLAVALDRFKEEFEVQLLLIPLHYPTDLEVSQKLRSLMEGEVGMITGNYSPQEVLGLVGQVDLLLGVRLHSLIFAALNKVPLVGISYDPKIDSFLSRLDLSPVGWIDKLGVEQLSQQIIGNWAKKGRIKSKINKKVDQLAGLARSNLELALMLFGGQDGR